MKNTSGQPNFDARWKDTIRHLHERIIEFFFPALYLIIDFSKGVRFLDKELQQLLPGWGKKGCTNMTKHG
ncbi:MAG: hypothetical protein R2830_12050 [Saprospiraceae bacterium]